MGNNRNWGLGLVRQKGETLATNEIQRDTGYAECLDTSIDRGAAPQRRKYVSGV